MCRTFKQSRSAFGVFTDSSNEVTITGLKPETSYELKLTAINGKGESERSLAEFFKTQPVRKCTLYITLQSFSQHSSHFVLNRTNK